jgi:NADPH:quinone reductase-like Zn-dependent oxidoreductase
MRAVVADRYGPVDDLRVAMIDVPPAPGLGEVVVQVHAAGVDRGTLHLVHGRPWLVRAMGYGLRRPTQPIPGLDLSGTVVAVGSSVTRFAPGDEVYGAGKGSLAEYALADEHRLAVKPANLGFDEAAVVAISGWTALQGCDLGGVGRGQEVLVLGASGGVGTYAVQIAKALGATVTGVCRTDKVDMVRSLGADRVVDYRTEDVTASARRYDVILDIGGNTPLRSLRRMLTPRGTLVVVGSETEGRLLAGFDRQLRALAWSPFVRQRLTMLVSKEHHEDLERLTALVEGGRLAPVLDRTYPLEQAVDALRRLEAGDVRGKVAITVR